MASALEKNAVEKLGHDVERCSIENPGSAEIHPPRRTDALWNLPNDCSNNVLSYLTIRDCLMLGTTSISSLIEIQSDLKRRQRRMRRSFVYRCLPDKEYVFCDGPSSCTDLLPTIRDRVESLCRALPRSHPSSGLARELMEDVDRPISSSENDVVKHGELSFERAFHELKKSIRFHRLHATVLSNAIYSDPCHWDKYGAAALLGVERDSMKLTVTLERYIGDVLCAYYLMGHSASGVVEGGPTEDAWMDRVISTPPTDASQCYRTWVFLHSTLLRTAPFTWEQQLRLGIASPLSSSSAMLDVAQGSLLRHPLPFGMHNHHKTMDALYALRLRDDFPPLRTTFNDFGPLGPTFRGRDLIQSHTFYPLSCMSLTRHFATMPVDDYTRGPTASFAPFLRSWANGEESVVQWLLQMHEEAVKTRPMTVTPPLVTIDCRRTL